MNWTQPVCTSCWVEDNSVLDGEGGALIRQPTRLRMDDFMIALHKCCKCGRATTSGIFIRIDPRTVPYPFEEEED